MSATNDKRTIVLLLLTLLATFHFGKEARSADPTSRSRAAWWFVQDEVEVIADFVNTSQPGKPAQFIDRVGEFRISVEDRALIITGDFPTASIWRFDLTTFEHQFDMRKLYVPDSAHVAFPDLNAVQTRRVGQMLGDPKKGLSHTGPWATYGGKWRVPTARVALDGKHVYTSWFDSPSIEDQAVGRVYASFALDIVKRGKHTIRISFDDFVYGTRWRVPRWKGETKPEVTYGKNDLRPIHIASLAIGEDERVRAIEELDIKPSLKRMRPRLPDATLARGLPKEGPLSIDDVEAMLSHVDFNRGETWEYSIDEESMASGNDMDAGRKALVAARHYDAHVARLSPAAKREWDKLFLERFAGLYTFFVFQRNYHPTGYAQNHSSATVQALIGGATVWDGPESEKWLRFGVMICRKRIELLGHDGGLEWMNEGRDYGLRYFETPLRLIKHATNVDLTANEPFFKNEWRYALHHAPSFPPDDSRRPQLISMGRKGRGKDPRGVAIPTSQTPKNTGTNHHFEDVDQVFMRSDWSDASLRARLWAGSVFGKHAAPIAKRYNWAHCRVNQGSFILHKGTQEIILEPGWTRTYRKSAANNNCILVNDTDQWAGGQVWHPQLTPAQISHIAHYADGKLLSVARADLAAAYPPTAKIDSLSRILLHIKPDTFLVFDHLQTNGPGTAQWRYHAAFVEPMLPATRYTVFGYTAAGSGFRDKSQSYGEAFQKDPQVKCDVAFLSPTVKASVGMSDLYYRWSKFSQPTRHLRVDQTSDGAPMTQLTAFSPKIHVKGKGNAYHGSVGAVRWIALVGKGQSDGFASDGNFALAVHDTKKGRTELFRFGGTKLSFRGKAIASAATDVFAIIQNGRVEKVVEGAP